MIVAYKQVDKAKLLDVMYKISLVLSALVTLVIVIWLLWYSRYGIDFTDEGFYLAWISDPWLYSFSATQFGFIYHPLYELLSGNIVGLRQANILITFGLAWLTSFYLFRQTLSDPSKPQHHQHTEILVLSAAVATSSFLIFKWWLLTPNYNGLALQAMLITGLGLILAGKHSSTESVIGWVLIAVGGWLAFMAKPTTAAALAVCAAIYLPLAGKCRPRLIITSFTLLLILLASSIWIIDGSIKVFIARLSTGIESAILLGGGHSFSTLLRWDDLPLSLNEERLFKILFSFVLVAIFSLSTKNKIANIASYGATAVPALLSLGILLGIYQPEITPGIFQVLQIAAAPLGAMAAAVTIKRLTFFTAIPRPTWALIGLFAALPYAYAFGTGSNYWSIAPMAGIFWVLIGLGSLEAVTTERPTRQAVLPLVTVVQLIVALLLTIAFENPYRQPQSLRLNQQPTVFDTSESKLVLSSSFAEYFDSIKQLTQNSGFSVGTPMIDFSGQSPTTLYSIGAKLIGQPWFAGGYPGSAQFMLFALDRVPCIDIAQAWLLLEPSGPRAINPEILQHYGADIQRDYVEVGRLNTPPDARGYKGSYTQILLKPSRTVNVATKACSTQREK